MTNEERQEKTFLVSQVFSPSAPIDKSALFAGRLEEVSSVINAVFQRGQHVIIYGERGVGKTSLANVLFDFLSQRGLKGLESGTINCDQSMDFSSLWHKIFRDMSVQHETQKAGFSPARKVDRQSLDTLLPDIVTPDDVRHVLQRLPKKSVIIIDEVDRLKKGDNTTALLADTIKTLSDHSIDTTLIFVGVADSVEELIAEHKSIERALIQIAMPRMSKEELFEILDKAFKSASLIIEPEAETLIAQLSKGLPHYTHLLGLNASLSAIQKGKSTISKDNVTDAINSALKKAQHSIISAYHKATNSPRENLYKQVLLACAIAQADFLGYFYASDLREPMTKIMQKKYDIPQFAQHLKAFCDEERGAILQRRGKARKYQYRFVNPLLQPFVIMSGISDGLVNASEIGGLQSK